MKTLCYFIVEIFFAICSLMKLNRIYQIEGSHNLHYNCPDDFYRTYILIKSDFKLQINLGSEVIQINDPQYNNLQLYLSPQCLETIYIQTINEFDILQQEYIEQKINLNQNNSFSVLEHQDLINCLQFDVATDKQLLLIEIESNILTLDQFEFILTSKQHTQRSQLDRAATQLFYKLLEQNSYHLFVFSFKLVNFQLYYYDPFYHRPIFMIQRSAENEFITIELSKSQISQTAESVVYIEVLLGEGKIQPAFDNQTIEIFINKAIQITSFYGNSSLYSKRGLYHCLCSVLISDHFDVSIIYRCYSRTLMLKFSNIYGVRYFTLPATPQILKLCIIYQIIDSFLIGQYFILPANQTLLFVHNSPQLFIQRQNGYIQQKILSNNTIQVRSETPCVVILLPYIQKEFIWIKPHQIYKIRKSQIFFTFTYQWAAFQIRTQQEDVVIQIYKDQSLKQPFHFENLIFFFEPMSSPLSIFILIKTTETCYITFTNPLTSSFQLNKKQMIIVLGGLLVYLPIHASKIQVIYETPVKYNFLPQLAGYEASSIDQIEFQPNQLFCILNLEIQNSQIIYKNQFSPLLQANRIILMYVTENHFVVILTHIVQFLQMDLKIENLDRDSTKLYLDSESKLNQIKQDPKQRYNILENHINVDLSFFECEKYDCLIQAQFNIFPNHTSITFQTCENILEGVRQVYYLYICNSFQQMIIFTLQGTIKIYEADQIIKCTALNCFLLFKQANTTLSQIQSKSNFIFSLPLNQLNMYINTSFAQILFYLNQTYLISIHSDQQLKLISQVDRIIKDYTMPVILDQGYYTIQLSQNNCEFLTIFTHVTLLYENITFIIYEVEQFSLLNSSQYLLLDSLSSLKYIYHNITFSFTQIHYAFIKLSGNEGDIIQFIGNGTIIAHYLQNPCFFIKNPQLIRYNDKFLVIAEMNKECAILNIQIMTGNSLLNIQFERIFSFDEKSQSSNLTLIGIIFQNNSDYQRIYVQLYFESINLISRWLALIYILRLINCFYIYYLLFINNALRIYESCHEY